MCMYKVINHAPAFYRARWLAKPHDMFKTRDANTRQREFPAGFPVEVYALNSLYINIFLDVVACIESRYVIRARRVFLVS